VYIPLISFSTAPGKWKIENRHSFSIFDFSVAVKNGIWNVFVSFSISHIEMNYGR